MPTVSVPRSRLLDTLPAQYSTDDAFDELCFDFGIELDAITTEADPALPAGSDPVTTYKIDVPANRYDLLCLEGLSQALRVFTGADAAGPVPVLTPPQPAVSVTVRAPTRAARRPFIVAAILRNLTLGPAVYASLIELQEKLHHNICRRRTLVAIGTHDLDTLAPPFVYDARPWDDVRFKPLRPADKDYSARELLTDVYPADAQLKKFVHLVQPGTGPDNEDLVPVLVDANDDVLSMPPIINGHLSRISPETRNMFIECTATDLTKAHIVLNTIVAMFSRYCGGNGAFTVEPVRIDYASADGDDDNADAPRDPDSGSVLTSITTPLLSTPEVTADVEYVARSVGLEDVSGDDMVDLLRRMQLPAVHKSGTLHVRVPVIRSDVLHACDVMNDVAVAYGFNKVPERVPDSATVGRQQPLNHLADLVRREAFAQHGYTEVLTWVTVSHAENFDMLCRDEKDLAAGEGPVKIGNPKTLEFQECRMSLLPGLLKTLRENRKAKIPLRLFEVGDVVLKDPSAEVLASNRRKMAAVYCAMSAGFEVIQGLLDQVMRTIGVEKGSGSEGSGTWCLDPGACVDPTLFPKRRASVIYDGRNVGTVGWLHPEVLSNFSLSYPCSVFEVDLQAFL